MYCLMKRTCVLGLMLCLALFGCDGSSDSSDSDDPAPGGGVETPDATDPGDETVDNSLKSKVLQNQAPYLPPQCYTQTVARSGDVYNSCYTCHTRGLRPDFINDNDLQLEFAFPAYAEENHWTNLFKDRSAAVREIGDDEILTYIRESNYMDADGRIIPADRLADLPAAWDFDEDGLWSGYTPDCHFNFDADGFDRNPSGGHTGWRAFAYYPFPSTHWPTNGEYADVLIRLPDIFQTIGGAFDVETYRTNLAVIEALIKKRDVRIPATDETRYDVDLDKDGQLGTAERITYDWAPNENRFMHYVGDARTALENGDVHLAAGLYPVGTEFLNTLRYIDVLDGGDIRMAARMKEIRYARKIRWLTYAELEVLALNEVKERDDFPDRLKLPIGDMEDGVSNGVGWVLQGFIEDKQGDLRPQTFEETASCIGCHGGIGATTDSTFALAHKLDAPAFQDGWHHWTQKDLTDVNEPKVEYGSAGVRYEYAFYLMYAGGGDEFRNNAEIKNKFYDENRVVKPEMAERIREDVSLLLHPSKDRALALNKVYKRIVEEQSYIKGRTPVIDKPEEVFETLKPTDLDTKVGNALILTSRIRDKACAPCIEPESDMASPDVRATVDGNGMSGPDGERYGIDADGFIDESNYAVTTRGVYFPFPPRHTLPTRMIVPLGAAPVCYECHRLIRAVPPENPQVTIHPILPPADADESDLVRLTDDPGTDVSGVWSPDGSRIAWESDRTGNFQIWMMNADGGSKQQVTQGPSVHGWAQWHPDGTRLLYWGYNPETGMHAISTADPDGGNVAVIVESGETLDRPVWSPQGDYISWGAQTDGNWDIWVATADGAQTWRLTHDAQMESNPLWRPDGSHIAYKVAPNKEYNLTIENFLSMADGFDAPTVRVWDGIKSIQMNDWSPAGDKIAYTAEIVTDASGEDRVSYLAVVEDVSFTGSKTSGTPVILSAHNTLGDRGPVFSPDGSRIAFWSWDKSYRATLWIADSDGSDLKQLTRLGPDMTPQWRPTGDELLFESARSGDMDLWTVAVE